jgi:hypothetical protein
MGLYDSAFATLSWLYGRDARSAITGITLIAGFASTIGWPMTAVFLHAFGWRTACLMWAGLYILLAAPLNWLMIPRHNMTPALPQAATKLRPSEAPRAAMPILAFFFAAAWFVQGAMAARLPGLLRLRVPRRPRQSPLRHWSALPRSAPASSSSDYCVRFTRFPRRELLRFYIRLAPCSSLCSVPRESSRSRCCTAPATA